MFDKINEIFWTRYQSIGGGIPQRRGWLHPSRFSSKNVKVGWAEAFLGGNQLHVNAFRVRIKWSEALGFHRTRPVLTCDYRSHTAVWHLWLNVHQNFTTAAALSFWLIGLASRIKKQFFRLIRKIPFVGMAVSISGKSVPPFSRKVHWLCCVKLLWVTLGWPCRRLGGGGPLAHLPSCTDDNIRLLRVIVSLAECWLLGFTYITLHNKLMAQWTRVSVWNLVTLSFLGGDVLDAVNKVTLSSLYGRFRVSWTRLWTTCLLVSVPWRMGWATRNSCPLKASLTTKCWKKSKSTKLWVSVHSRGRFPTCLIIFTTTLK